MVNDGNNAQLLVENQCTRVRQKEDAGRPLRAVSRRIKVATQYGWIAVQMVDVPYGGVPIVYAAAGYLSGPCIPDWDVDSIEAFIAKREKKPIPAKVDGSIIRNMCREFILNHGYSVTEWKMLDEWKISRSSLETWTVNTQFNGGLIGQEIRYQSKACRVNRIKGGALIVNSVE